MCKSIESLLKLMVCAEKASELEFDIVTLFNSIHQSYTISLAIKKLLLRLTLGALLDCFSHILKNSVPLCARIFLNDFFPVLGIALYASETDSEHLK